MSEDALAARAVQALDRMAAAGGPRPPLDADAVGGDDDDDSWLELGAGELDAAMRGAESMLRDAAQGDDAAPGLADVGEEGAAQGLRGMLEAFEAFLSADSGVDGADLMGDSSGSEYAEGSDEDIDLDAEGILGALMEAIGASEPAHVTSQGDSPGAQAASSTSREDADAGIVDAMDAMDQELAATHIGRSFDRHESAGSKSASEAAADSLPDVNVDLNLVRNIVESFRAQEGLAGPAGTLLGQAGIRLPPPGSDDGSEHGSVAGADTP
ncbi:hypothetical protein LPJ61_000218 [Coemansia biformis]|uniref:Uncharacterized protein n=1 Tax=Coemansia biformis TaxID=1286918 RepID=A0A9W7YC62_9FUNG|nr:hypothetical protein LPJ61_000218 [Coemansia biformis]